ncbi:MAG: MarC family protein [Cyclobacteriaceae bacterium]|nr:MarC family protein [Cyclobacteriaceae bacterium]MCK5705848.1 MarC family protein [Cyclobacteriaceae bacterium]
MINFKEIATVTLILFSIIDILGSIPIIIDLRKKNGKIESGKATLVAGIIMIAFLFIGEVILNLFGIDVESFAIAGAIIILIIGMEMILDRSFFKQDPGVENSASIVPLAFPLIAGAGSLTTILSLKAAYGQTNILIGIIVNLVFVFIVLKSSVWLEKKLGQGGFNILRKVFGIILLSLAIKLLKDNLLS